MTLVVLQIAHEREAGMFTFYQHLADIIAYRLSHLQQLEEESYGNDPRRVDCTVCISCGLNQILVYILLSDNDNSSVSVLGQRQSLENV